ncbi:hypothetical protein N7530_009693 [Penicillium desertorum]|uniref:Uncharacterized protein n=1 Tax=Penicillium desertorum TaxID=1303715 RepID=A0A9W9WJJ1_9EURO|nr:hypothetical protein N7530_009693 [Penicillium desertorum]
METKWSANFENSHEKAPFDLVANLLDLNDVDICEQVKHRVATVPSPYTVSWDTGDGSPEGWGGGRREEEEVRWEAFYTPRTFLRSTLCNAPSLATNVMLPT